jgi:hypothetical protein
MAAVWLIPTNKLEEPVASNSRTKSTLKMEEADSSETMAKM